ncbi:MAG: fumarylacetoacetate hydrolase family protein [Bacteroidetes bacterium]|nr:fumarylacetoacetate hydrolase family protein [Bacteroidota bacterium]
MKLVTFAHEGRALLGALVGDMVMDLQAAHTMQRYIDKEGDILLPNEMNAFLREGNSALDTARKVEDWFRNAGSPTESKGERIAWPLDEVTLLAPVPHPTSMRDAYAFRQHVEAARRNRGVDMIPEYDEIPIFYFTNHNATTGPGVVEVMDLHLDKLDFELECAIVIGREGRNISAAEADDYIAGYTVMNDWSARGLQMHEMKLNLGPAKGKDFATSIGPWLVTKDELQDKRISGDTGERYDLVMTCTVNGEEVSRGNLKDMSWTFAQIIERASYGVTLYPGDVIGSGTVGTGCFLELNGSKVYEPAWWLKDGDVVVCDIERLGRLENIVRHSFTE